MVRRLSGRLVMMASVLLLSLKTSLAFGMKECPDQLTFQSELEAVIAALNSFNPDSVREDREYMGAIFREGDRYGYSVVAGRRGRDRISLRVAGSEWERVSAFWHTHGGMRSENRYFSAEDTELVDTYKKPLYLGDYTGYLKRFAPGDRKLSRFAALRLGLPNRPGAAIGELLRDENARLIRIETRLGNRRRADAETF
jgi:hypothetical protein